MDSCVLMSIKLVGADRPPVPTRSQGSSESPCGSRIRRAGPGSWRSSRAVVNIAKLRPVVRGRAFPGGAMWPMADRPAGLVSGHPPGAIRPGPHGRLPAA